MISPYSQFKYLIIPFINSEVGKIFFLLKKRITFFKKIKKKGKIK